MDVATLQHQGGEWSGPFPAVDGPGTLVLAFGAPAFGASALGAGAAEGAAGGPLADLRAAYPNSILAGCSTAGEIFGADVQDHSVVAAVIRFRRCALRAVEAEVGGPEASLEVGARLAAGLLPPEGDQALRAVLVFSDGTRVNGSRLVEGLRAGLPPGLPVSGGLAGDGVAFRRTWVLTAAGPREGGVVAVGIYGAALRVGQGSRGGWDAFGPERTITRAREHVLYELDGRPALDLYREYLGALADQLPGAAMRFPLSIRASRHDPQRVVRTILSIDEAARSMTFAGNLPEGHLAQFMHARHDQLIDGAAEASSGAGAGSLRLAISCVGRRVVLGERAEEEVEAALEAGIGTMIGFYSYGEIAPGGLAGCDLHNQTMTVTTLSEAPDDAGAR